jgi:prepilin-type N-terminal cleavage/methylation domain-containing protein
MTMHERTIGPLSRKRVRRAAAKRGFTLLEVLISSVLMTLVLGTLWEMFHVYSQLFERGGIEARQARLVTALQRQFVDDLQSAIEDSPRPNDSSAGSAVRRFGLQGGPHTLRFDVLQTLPDDQLPSGEDSPTLGRASTSKPQVPELKTVIYRFVSRRRRLSGQPEREEATENRDEPSAEASFARPGLTRWEIDFETPLEKTAARSLPTTEATEDANVEPSSPAPGGGTSFEDLVAQATAAEAATWLPEVRGATFRYFDGHAWSDSWNSLTRGSLPAAVEVRLRLRDPAEANRRRRQRQREQPDATPQQADVTPQQADDSSEPSTETAADNDQRPQPLDENGRPLSNRQPGYRFLIRLPIAQHRPELKVVTTALGGGASAEGNPATTTPAASFGMVPSPALLPPSMSPNGPAADQPDLPLPDQWMRTVPP